jgi:hypothetical protein
VPVIVTFTLLKFVVDNDGETDVTVGPLPVGAYTVNSACVEFSLLPAGVWTIKLPSAGTARSAAGMATKSTLSLTTSILVKE